MIINSHRLFYVPLKKILFKEIPFVDSILSNRINASQIKHNINLWWLSNIIRKSQNLEASIENWCWGITISSSQLNNLCRTTLGSFGNFWISKWKLELEISYDENSCSSGVYIEFVWPVFSSVNSKNVYFIILSLIISSHLPSYQSFNFIYNLIKRQFLILIRNSVPQTVSRVQNLTEYHPA